MSVVESVKVKWGNGFLELICKNEVFIINAKNYTIELRPRTLIIHGRISGYEQAEVVKYRKRRYMYIRLSEEIIPIPGPGRIIKEILYGNFEIRRQDFDFEKYMTIITPGAYLYEYIIITSDTIAVAYSLHRDAYVDVEEGLTTIYFV